MFYRYSYVTCFDHNFCHHQTLNEHISSNQTHTDPYLLTDYCVATVLHRVGGAC
jgi:hypothetical protein